jgi:predicted RNase H-like HicB family nuclease
VGEALTNLKEAAELHLQEIGPEGLRLRPVERRRISVEIP